MAWESRPRNVSGKIGPRYRHFWQQNQGDPEWSERVSALHARIRLSELAPPAQALLLQSLSDQLRRLDALFENDVRD